MRAVPSQNSEERELGFLSFFVASESSVQDEATMSRLCESSADRISHLPYDVMQRILSFLPVKDVARTATLSKQWRHNWRANTQLVFDGDFGEISKEGSYDSNASKLMFQICKALMVHDGPITKFVLEIPGLRRPSPDINHMVHFLAKKGVQELALIFSDDGINDGNPMIEREMPSALFSACQLSSLILRDCDFSVAPSWFLGFSKLTHLELAKVNVESSFYSDFLPNCPLLQDLKLFICGSAVESHLKAELVAPSLKVFESNVWNVCFKHTPLLSVVSITLVNGSKHYKLSGFDVYNPDIAAVLGSLPAIQELVVGLELLLFFASGNVPCILPTHLHHLKVLELHYIILDRLSEARVLLCLIRSSPNLQRLLILTGADDTLPQNEVIDSLPLLLGAEDHSTASCFQCLEELSLKAVLGTRVELDLLRFVLATAPLLRRIFIRPAEKLDTSKSHKFLKEMTQYKRASKEAEIIYFWNDEADT
ncbi:unnamed protein product [Linum tenue]|uniref:F-box domain-containing protein n=1 Tax=Linum tenue TaxID=586396 RepID=A0AAV0NIM9_9ROSI|nr:unnamed protein product [Linum tenue]